MKRNVPFKVFRNIGLPVVAAGAVLFTAPTSSEAAANPLYKGDNGEKVEHLQELLAQQGYLKTDEVTGTYKGSTKEAVTTYQQKHDLAVDGIAGVQTVGALTELSYGDEGALVKDLQKQLNELQFYKGELDGAFGPLTDEAVRDFQANVGIAVDGYAGPETYRELYYRQPAQAPVKEEQPKQEQAEQKQAAQEQAEQEQAAQEQAEQEQAAQEQAAQEQAAQEQAEQEQAAQEQAAQEQAAQEQAEQEQAAQEQAAQEQAAQEQVEQEQAAQEQAEQEQAAQEQAEQEQAAQEQAAQEQAAQAQAPAADEGQATYQMEATAYTANCEGCTGITATGIDLNANPNQRVVAVDPDVIPLGSRVHVEGYGEAIAGDTGGAINGQKIDLYVQSRGEALNFGRQTVNVTVLD